jgi:hypothetical protein
MSKTDLRLSTNTDSQGGQPVCIVIVQAGKTVATCYNTTPESEAQLAEIVRRHNCYEPITKACAGVMYWAERVNQLHHAGNPILDSTWSELFAACNNARAALASAKAKP